MLPGFADCLAPPGIDKLNAQAQVGPVVFVTTSPRRSDALVITGAFQLAGFPYVIGTLWPVGDLAARRMATDVYTHLTQAGTNPPDPRHRAMASHSAVRALRAESPATPTLWAAHTHTGI
ncbi:hypothetical protein GCM10029964_028590 [Kibdelosporangium lantanae]